MDTIQVLEIVQIGFNVFLAFIGIIFVIAILKAIFTPDSRKHEIWLNAALKGDFDALCELVNEYMEGQNSKYFKKYPEHAVDVFNAAQKLVEIVESNDRTKKPELEDYYWLGLMYEEGFGTAKDKEKALEYFNKALSTNTCWDGDNEHYQELISTIKQKIQKY